MIDVRRQQRRFGDGFIRETVDELWEGWMRHADAILGDEELLEAAPSRLTAASPAQPHAWSTGHTRGGGAQDVVTQAYPRLKLR